MGWFDRHARPLLLLLAVGVAALLVKQGIAVARYGLGGWLRGDGPAQTEWEVRAVVGLLLVAFPAVLIAGLVRSSEGLLQRVTEWRWARAIRRSRHRG